MSALNAGDRRQRDGSTLYVVGNSGVEPLDRTRRDMWSAGLSSLVDQEVHGRRNGEVPARVQDLLDRFGFEWEPAAEPGHMRFQPPATTILREVARYAEARTRALAADLGLAFDQVEGVNVVDGTAPLLKEYLDLIDRAPGIYGTAPYQLAAPNDTLLLRQTACLQKFSIAHRWNLVGSALPRCIYELSDSFRHEPEANLQPCFRLRRFRVPEAHLHVASLTEAVELGRLLHVAIADALAEWTADVAVLVSVTHDFFIRYQDFIEEVASSVGGSMLLNVRTPGALCEDGVEIDVEYKFVDANGFARELTTFQIDELITRSFGVSTGSNPVATIHLVLTGSLERFVFAAFDRIASAEALGRPTRLPLWMAPTIVRIVWPPDSPPDEAVLDGLQRVLVDNGVRCEFDDRSLPMDQKIESAADAIVPFQVHLDDNSRCDAMRFRRYESSDVTEVGLAELVGHITGADDFAVNQPVPAGVLLSRAVGARG